MDGADYDYVALLARALRPERPRLASARDVAAQTTDPREAWEALASRGVVPMDWADEGTRVFRVRDACPACGRRGGACGACGGRGELERASPSPPTVRACVALAANPDGVATAEALARELAARLAPPGTRATSPRCVWLTARADEWRPSPEPLAPLVAELARAHAPRDVERARALRASVYRAIPPGGRPPDAVAARVADVAFAAALWRRAAERGLVVDGRATRGAPDPFEPLLELWSTGYALDALEPGVVVLLAPEV